MIKTIIKIGVVALIGLLAYNYFLGNAEEKAASEKIVAGVKDVGSSIGGVIKSESEKLSEGKMDRIIDDLGDMLDRIRGKAGNQPEVKDKVSKLNDMLRLLNEEMKVIKTEKGTEGKERRALRKKINQVEEEIQKLAREVGITTEAGGGE